MALVKFGNGVAAISGRVDGSVFSRTRAGAIIRGWAKPTSTPTINQVNQRTLFSLAAAGWNALTPTQKIGWTNVANDTSRLNRLGEPYTPSGREMYMSSNVNMMMIDPDSTKLINEPPANFLRPSPPNLPAIGAAEETADVLTTLTLGADEQTDITMIAECVNPAATSATDVSNVSNQWRSIGIQEITTLAPEANYATGFNVAFAGVPIPAGTVLQIRVATIDTNNGQRSDWAYLDKIAVTPAA